MGIDLGWEEKLQPLVDRDHFIREALVKRRVLEDSYHPEMEKVQIENAQKLKMMIHKKGFPVLSNAGEKGVRLSWLIIHHAISLPDFMKEALIQMRMAASIGDYPYDLLAYTEDRVAFFEGRPQLYGTNFDWDNGELKPSLIEDDKYLDARRRAMGLPPMGDNIVQVTDSLPPKDPVKKQKEFHVWLKKVGWQT